MPRNLMIWNSSNGTWREVRPIDSAHFRFLPASDEQMSDLDHRGETSEYLALQAELADRPVAPWPPVAEWD